jgi:hypothetical protein
MLKRNSLCLQVSGSPKQYNKNKSHTKQVNGRNTQPENEPNNKKPMIRAIHIPAVLLAA